MPSTDDNRDTSSVPLSCHCHCRATVREAAAPLVAELEDWPEFESDTLMVRVRLGAIRRLKEAL